MHSVVSTKDLNGDLNPALFSHELIGYRTKLRAAGLLSTVADCATSLSGYAFPSECFSAAGEPVAKIGNLNDSPIDIEDCECIDKPAHFNSRFRRSDEVCLIAGTGATVGKVAYKGVGRTVWINQRVFALLPKSENDIGYVFACLTLPVARQQITAYASGAAQPNISDTQVLDCCIPRASFPIQKYIGDKVRQAERVRANAKCVGTTARSTMSSYIPISIPDDFHQRPRRIESRFASPASLSAEFGHARIGHLLFENAVPLHDLVDSCKCGEAIEKSSRKAGQYLYYGASGPIDRHDEFNFEGEHLIAAQDGTIGCACVARGRFWANNHVWILKIKPEFDADAIAVYLNDFYPFWKGMTTGSVVPKVTSENLLSVVVPLGIASATESIGAGLRNADRSSELAADLVNASKLLVEALIERKVTEAELINAQTQLEQGDDSADRAILSRLFEGGWGATETRPLFPDLDAYYKTLRMVDHAQADGASQ